MLWRSEREDKLSSDNKSVLATYQAELAKRRGVLCSTVASSMSQQNEQLECIDKICYSLLDHHNEVANQIYELCRHTQKYRFLSEYSLSDQI